MKKSVFIILIAALAIQTFGQKPRSTPAKTPKPTPKPTKTVVPQLGTETEEFEKAKAVADAADYERLHRKQLAAFPHVARIRSHFTLRRVSRRLGFEL